MGVVQKGRNGKKKQQDKGKGDTSSGSGSGEMNGFGRGTEVKGRVFQKRLTSEETQEGVPKAWYNQYQQFFEDMDKSHLMDSCQEYGWDKSVCDRQGAMDEAECEKAIQEMSKQCKAKEPEYPMLRSNQQLVLRSGGGQTRERKRAAWRSIIVSWRQTCSHSQIKKDTKEEWWCKQPSESTLQPMLTLTTRQIHFSFQTLLNNSLPYERKNFTASAFTNSIFPRLHCCSLALLFMYSLSSALGNAPLSSSILFLAMFHKPFCAVKRPTSNSSFRLFQSFLGKTFFFRLSTLSPFCLR